MSTVPGVKDEVRVDGETKIGGFRFQKYLKEKVVHIHDPEDGKTEYTIKEFLKHTDKFMTRLKDIQEGETIKLLDLKVNCVSDDWRGKKVELELDCCSDTVKLDVFKDKMKEFVRLLEKR